ncbi:MAG: hypothetical protein WBE26_13855 [Phycisphaerae bacterium]
MLTSAERLLQLEAEHDRDIAGWRVAAILVAVVREFGLDVISAPTEEDPGHCLIVPTQRQPFTKRLWSKLARETEIAHPPVDNGK